MIIRVEVGVGRRLHFVIRVVILIGSGLKSPTEL